MALILLITTILTSSRHPNHLTVLRTRHRIAETDDFFTLNPFQLLYIGDKIDPASTSTNKLSNNPLASFSGSGHAEILKSPDHEASITYLSRLVWKIACLMLSVKLPCPRAGSL